MLSRKRPGRHPRFGTIYYYCLSVVFASAAIMSRMRWAEDYHLFILGTLSFATASLGRIAIWRRRRNRIRLPPVSRKRSRTLGVYFSIFTDTKSVTGNASCCNYRGKEGNGE